MKLLPLRNSRAHRFLVAAACGLLVFLLAIPQGVACSWDYPIWIVRSKDADPLYRFAKDGKAGYIDRSGKIVIQPQFDAYGNYGGEFHSGLLALGVGDGPYADTSGKIALNKGYYRSWDFSEGLAAAMPEDGGKWGYIDRTGEFVISPRFDSYPLGYVSSFSDGLAIIEVNGRDGYIDRTGEFVIKPQFPMGGDFHEGLARVVVEGPCSYSSFMWEGGCPDSRLLGEEDGKPVSACKFTFIDRSGAIISRERYDYAREFSEGLAPVLKENKWGYIDKKGKMVIAPKFDAAAPFSDGLARVKQGELWGYIDHTGKLVIAPQFQSAEDFSDGLAVVYHWNEDDEDKDETTYYINQRGAPAFAESFVHASPFFKGLAHVKLKTPRQTCPDDEMDEEGSFAYIDVTGRKIFTYLNCEPEDDD